MKRHIRKNSSPFSTLERTVLNEMDAYLYVVDPATDKILSINGKMKERIGNDDNVVGRVCWKVFRHDLDDRCDYCPMDQLLENPGSTVVWEEHNENTDRYYKNISRMIQWPDGRRVHLLCGTDITDIRRAKESLERRLKQQEVMSVISQSFSTTRDMHELIFEALKIAGEFMGVNHSFLSVYRKEEGCLECLNEWFDEGQPFIGGESKWSISPDMDIYKDLMENGYAAVNDYKLLTHPKFQTVKDYDLRAFLNIPIEISGEFWGIIGFIINKRVHEWCDSDIYLGKLIAGVFSSAVSRGIVEESLSKAKEDAERASRSKGDFLSSMSHEIRTPMNAIIGLTQLARNSGDSLKIEYYLERIDSASKQLLGLINDILDMSKIEANKIELSTTEFDLEKMLINIASVVNFTIEEKKQNFIVNIDKGVPFDLIGDELRLSQVITNLLTNAAKFTPEGGSILLNIRSIGEFNGIATLLFEVIDNGIGITQEQKARLFNPFEQADTSTTRKFGGTGLGLSICKGIVELMQGHIWIDSEMGKGSKFSFTIQIGLGNTLCEHRNALGRDDLRALAVATSPALREYFLNATKTLNLPCDVSGTGAAAMEMIGQNKEDQYNVFFVDLLVSDFSGIELIKEIKRMVQDSSVIAVTSATAWGGIETDATEAGVDGFITKPLFPSSIVKAVNESFGIMPAVQSTDEKTRTHDFSEHTLLVAEDIEINREIISAVLEDTKISIDFAESGLEALAMFETNTDRYSLILMDIQMPEMDGYEATKKIRAIEHERGRSIPIIAMTANVFLEDVERCIQSGMNDHIGKPLDFEELLSKLGSYLKPGSTDSERIGET